MKDWKNKRWLLIQPSPVKSAYRKLAHYRKLGFVDARAGPQFCGFFDMWNAKWSGDFPRAGLGIPELRAIHILQDNAASPESMLNRHGMAIPSVAPAAPVSV